MDSKLMEEFYKTAQQHGVVKSQVITDLISWWLKKK